MRDYSFKVHYCERSDMVIFQLGSGAFYLAPVDAAKLVDQLTAALDVYASTLKAVA
ncbi:hypothetical protein [Nocardia salmonicida]|uniref:hypothetical protein n=1 Tax=Nocardia salmonicida TaxID=53431 RepID=UPI000A447098|nr:hypothetical protein [Nocardia salmonicida]